MSKSMKLALGIVLGSLLMVGSVVGYIVSAKFAGEKYEQSIFAQDESMQNTWAMTQQQLQMGGVTVKNYGETFIKSLEANAKRYENDKGSMMKWVQEAAGAMSPDLHKQLMISIEKVYTKKEAVQLSKISKVQEYRTWRTSTIKGTVGSLVWNFPSEKALKIENRIISTKETKQTWETGEDQTVNLF